MAGRTIAIGDIHGCVFALNAILDAVRLERDDLIVCLGRSTRIVTATAG